MGKLTAEVAAFFAGSRFDAVPPAGKASTVRDPSGSESLGDVRSLPTYRSRPFTY